MPRFTSKLRSLSPSVAAAALAATAAAAAALWNRHKAKQVERAHPPVGRFIGIDGTHLHYSDSGTGPCIVLLHGNMVTLQDFEASGVTDGLAENFRVVSFDRPGFGHSDRPRNRLWTAQAQAALIQRALNELGIAKPIVVGHSWGTLVALSLAVDFPGELRGLVLISGYYFPSARLDVAMTAPVALPVVGDVIRYTASPFAGRLLIGQTVKAMFSPQPVPGGFFDAMPREMLLRPGQIRATSEDAAFMIPAAARLRAHYASIDIPVRIFAGTGDKIVDPQAHAVRLQDVLPNSTLDEVPDAGHMVHHKIASSICAAVADMATRNSPTLVSV
ncbi:MULTISPECIES: alpha/beta hydrolase [unclassified Caballeronia]|uniref:alpha/beta fold hydrolase n=1 Tax=unclassified Caballeronia TaxID=2646786 RepID=UPI00285F697B|nr:MULTISPECIES: alpha/beta hydrolase [unclassified Caballeronia]MDR5777335.1 alpha/beta hydrolase [Caballeronia sp. LZ002]MDR5852783.1 alpha/beta hydrolase [Caballeronia sp. LZ003]